MTRETPDPQDEFWHEPLNDSPLWRESYYFDFYDEDADLAYFSSIGNRVNKGNMGSVAALVWEGTTYVRKDYSHPTVNEAIQVDGLLYEAVTPNEEWRVRHLGQINEFEPGSNALELPADEYPFRDKPLHTLDMDLHYEGIHDPVYYDPEGEAREIFSSMYHGHSDQALRVTGSVRIGDETVEIDCYGERDHSWGIRDWRDPDTWQWTTAVFDDDTAVNFWEVRKPEGTAVEGYLHLDGRSELVADIEVTTQYREDGYTQDTFDVTVTDHEGRSLDVSAETLTVVPVNFSYDDEVTTVRRTPTRYEANGKTGHGWTEYATTLPASEMQ